MTQIEIRDVTLSFPSDPLPTLQGLNLSVSGGEFVSIIGRSGCGKTSLIRMIAGLLQPTTGQVLLDGQGVSGPSQDVTYVFQKPILLEWRNLLENILLPLELQRKVTPQDGQKAREILAQMGLKDAEEKFPHECSGGMLSRVALARALLTDPKLLLMDEPFAALDSLTKEQLQSELGLISCRFQPTVVFITHDITEAVYLSDRVVLLGGQPAAARAQYLVPFPRPRANSLKFEPQFLTIVKNIYDDLDLEG